MPLDIDTLRRLSLLLDNAMELDEARQAEWLNGLQGDDAKLVPTLRDMLSHLDSSNSADVLERGLNFTGLKQESQGENVPLCSGDMVGPYRLLRELGRGGMGAVWLAARIDGTLNREVALKLPHAHIANRQLAERFNQERDILATLVHPHIARLYDAGVGPEGRPYLALEYVDGEPIGSYCEAHRLSVLDRLKIFMQVLSAVQYAHNRLVVHRDLKPSNVLITADGQVRLLDFGIAKMLTEGKTEDSALTRLGGRALTPHYAAPEQVMGQTLSISMDIYSLGVMLYELLTGALPYRPKRDTAAAMEEAILENEAVAPSRSQQGTSLTEVQRKWLRGDLDTIILKALKKDPQARYANVSELTDDLQRFMRGEPVLAQPDSALYRARKFLLRNRWGVAAATLAMASLCTGLGFSLWQAQVAKKEARTASAVKDFMQGIFLANSVQQPDPQRARQTSARELLDIGAAKLDAALDKAPEAKLEMLKMFTEIYSQLDLTERALEFGRRHLNLTRSVHGANSPEAVNGLLELVAALRGHAPDNPEIGDRLNELATLLQAHSGATVEQRSVHAVLAAEYFVDHDFVKAASYAHQAIDLLNKSSDAGDAAMILAKAAKIDLIAGDCASSLSLATQGTVAAHASNAAAGAGDGGNTTLPSLSEVLGRSCWCLDRGPEAERHLRVALEDSRKFFGNGDMETVRIQARLADFLLTTRSAPEGAALLEQAASSLRQHAGAETSHMYLEALASVGHALLNNQQPAQAQAHLAKILQIRANITASPTLAAVLRDLASAKFALNHPDDAVKDLDRAVTMRVRSGLRNVVLENEETQLRLAMSQR